ncbi:MAG: hypothetical protein HY651_06510 [Acidobacteria bacterium]|nr:hypothetical protein [Acidobacteriota bacterium]
MADANKNDDADSQRLGPFEVALDSVQELSRFVEMSWAGLGYAQTATRILDVKLRALQQGHKDVPAIHPEDRQRAERLERFAKEQSAAGFSYLYSLAAIRLWTIVETFVQDLVLKTIGDFEAARNHPAIRKLKGPLLEFYEASTYQQAELILNLLIDDLGIAFKKGVGRFEEILGVVGLGGPVEDEVRRLLLELTEVRNLLVHRNGVVDARFAKNCPWIATKVGESVRITNRDHDRYQAAVQWYILEVEKRRSSIYEVTAIADDSAVMEELITTQAFLVNMLRTPPDSGNA